MAEVALVTGASRGIGRAIALRLAEDGLRVAVHYTRQREAAESVAEAIGARCVGVFQAELTEPEGRTSLWRAVSGVASVTTLVNNAGIYEPQAFAETTLADLRASLARTFELNFVAPFELTQLAVADWRRSGTAGKVLNVASRVGFRGEPGAAIYAASKAALINLTRSLAVELAPEIGVFGIAPGWVETAMARDGMGDRLPSILATLPMGRMATPEDCANAASFLLRAESSYLSGVTLDINGASYFH
ncbi:MAG: SDR family oxidoreductase [Fimbriimonadaceae bacterium]|nr:SDR family oxidoreductase [Fimbriimonadaceae bacterium]